MIEGGPAADGEPLATDSTTESTTESITGPTAAVKPRRRIRRWVKRGLLVVMVLLIPVVISYVRALTGPGSDSLQARSVEWARENHLGGLVDRVEHYWYAHHQAPVGGTPNAGADQLNISTESVAPAISVGQAVNGITVAAGAPGAVEATTTTFTRSQSNASPETSLEPSPATAGTPTPGPMPSQPGGPTTIPALETEPQPARTAAETTAAATTPAVGTPTSAERPPPSRLSSPTNAPLANEGTWSPIGPLVGGRHGAYATLIRPDPVHTSVLDAVVWIDPTLLSFRQYPGQKIPGAPWDRPDFVEPEHQASLLAAFEGGFRLADSNGGMFLGSKLLKPLRSGGATFVIDKNGVPDVGLWGRDFTTTDTIDSARQNLDLIVDRGAIAPTLATDPNRAWGFTGPANKDAVWRSGVGITADGALVWVGGDGLSIVSLASTLVAAGAVRGMQLDINHEWVQFNTYGTDSTGAVHGERLLAAMQHSDDRYLTEDTRDFIAVFER